MYSPHSRQRLNHIKELLRDPRVHAAFGFHPLLANHVDAASIAELRRAFEEVEGKAVALGECGLDFHRPPPCPGR